ncbi:hypothetical protein JAAARDRAFT_51327 [Jaapia argillacea MUCL 33604]|uniref:Uncharacterized protein n=1 Tax=Jaapia argillacea MUCL 33604 TaxID=933084 RepID=A0A067P968_9AGAM|nr:hypothetical protein JAAARDRAFT_51327 [Jaapia argillacea MUCL 33604]
MIGAKAESLQILSASWGIFASATPAEPDEEFIDEQVCCWGEVRVPPATACARINKARELDELRGKTFEFFPLVAGAGSESESGTVPENRDHDKTARANESRNCENREYHRGSKECGRQISMHDTGATLAIIDPSQWTVDESEKRDFVT